MRTAHQHKLETFRRVRDFGIAWGEDFSADSMCPGLSAEITRVIQGMESCDIRQSSQKYSARAYTVGKRAARGELPRELECLFRAIRAMTRATPGMAAKFAVSRRTSDPELITRARDIVAAAEPMAAELPRCELPPDFLDILRVKINAMEQSLTRRQESRSGRMEAISTINDLVAHGRRELRTLDGLIRNKYHGDTNMLRKWNIATRSRRSGKRTGATPEDQENTAQLCRNQTDGETGRRGDWEISLDNAKGLWTESG